MRWCFIILYFFLSNFSYAENNDLPTNKESAEASQAEIAQAVPIKDKGQSVYQQYCYVCHQDGVAGAPRFQQSEDWAIRLKSQSLDELTASAIKGLNAMPAKGTCSECSDEDIKQAIQYMLPNS